ncbi:hypothetical protein DL89DRAFT_265471 [Linderina pennispora]|uniref:Extracellular metalloproteinase n=1 Tax=Linderina pennispora TaxID=61395 RepID=A0A1Y1WIJ5_9FUNG|nr:uncharacterized protein DL89DRAFT_265471 [Linderina pennispora]ORX73401.1 hypothetical protein DL89DRAFT_265471 [Linderina pennispora]
MVRLSFSLGYVACILLAVKQVDGHQQPPVKTFSPTLKNKGPLTIYEHPLDVKLDSPVQVSSFAPNGNGAGSLKSMTNVAIAYLTKTLAIPATNIKVTDAYTDTCSGITHLGDVDVVNGQANVNIDAQGRVISSSNSFASADALNRFSKRSRGSLTSRANSDASIVHSLKSLSEYQIKITNVPTHVAATGESTAKKALLQTDDGSLVPVWHIVMRQESSWWSAHVNQGTNKIEAINDWVSHYEAYNVFPRTIDTPNDGKRTVVTNPADAKASPKGWVTGNGTRGNNVWAQNNPTGGNSWKDNHRPSSTNGVFNYPLDLSHEPASYVDAATTQLFYTVNTMHDLSYLYGFDEGAGGDYVVAFAQDGSSTNNANFAAPPDGQNGVMRMFVWDLTNPHRDGDFEQSIVAHEYTHGISKRLTGGPSNADCLNSGEASGMGEGWSDTVANLLRIKPGDSRRRDMVVGSYVTGQGIRDYPYSTNMKTNPLTYGQLDTPNHQGTYSMGTMWATILYEMIWNLIDAHGIATDLFTHDLSKGNCLALQLILNGMKLQPCNPSFIDARNAILQAEKNLTGGKNKCAIWKAFSKRGMGPKASGKSFTTHVADNAVPAGC